MVRIERLDRSDELGSIIPFGALDSDLDLPPDPNPAKPTITSIEQLERTKEFDSTTPYDANARDADPIPSF